MQYPPTSQFILMRIIASLTNIVYYLCEYLNNLWMRYISLVQLFYKHLRFIKLVWNKLFRITFFRKLVRGSIIALSSLFKYFLYNCLTSIKLEDGYLFCIFRFTNFVLFSFPFCCCFACWPRPGLTLHDIIYTRHSAHTHALFWSLGLGCLL